MESALLLLRLVPAAIFIVAGIAKFLDLKGSEKAFKDFGVPASIAMPLSVLLSVVEIAIGLMFLSIATAWHAAIVASALLLLFIGQMVYQMARGNAPDCHCFGQIHSAPVSGVSIARNSIFTFVTLFLVSRGITGQGMSLADPALDFVQLVLGVIVVALLLSAVSYLRKVSEQQKELMRRFDVMELVAREGASVERIDAGHPHDGLPIGAVFPDFKLPDIDGTEISLADVRGDNLPMLFLFVSTSCNPCKALVPEFDQWQAELAGRVKFVFVSSGKAEENRDKFGGDAAKVILLQTKRELADIVHGQWTPTAIFVDAKGRIASHATAGDNAIRNLVEQIKAEEGNVEFKYFTNGSGHTHARNLIGTEIPEFSLKDLDGRTIKRSDLLGRETLVTFWSLSCPHCQTMMSELREWDMNRGEDDPALIVFSDGEPAEHQEIGLKSPILLEKNHKTAAEFGMFGTPSAVLVNEQGRIITETAVGAPNIWSLIGKRN